MNEALIPLTLHSANIAKKRGCTIGFSVTVELNLGDLWITSYGWPENL